MKKALILLVYILITAIIRSVVEQHLDVKTTGPTIRARIFCQTLTLLTGAGLLFIMMTDA